MALYFCAISAPDSHIEFLRSYPRALEAYIEGRVPVASELAQRRLPWFKKLFGNASAPTETTPVVPSDWPMGEPDIISPEDINHRVVELYHMILNGTKEHVEGAGTLFQTWFSQKHGAIFLETGDGAHAFASSTVKELVGLFSEIDFERVKTMSSQWWRGGVEGQDELCDDECNEYLKEMVEFSEELKRVVERGDGLIWFAS